MKLNLGLNIGHTTSKGLIHEIIPTNLRKQLDQHKSSCGTSPPLPPTIDAPTQFKLRKVHINKGTCIIKYISLLGDVYQIHISLGDVKSPREIPSTHYIIGNKHRQSVNSIKYVLSPVAKKRDM